MEIRRYANAEIQRLTEEAAKDGFCILRGHFPRGRMAEWYDKFTPLLEDHIKREGQLQNRGPGRYYVTLPFDAPFADEEIFCDPDILAIVENLVGADFTMAQ